MVANDNAGYLDKRGALGFFASGLAPTGIAAVHGSRAQKKHPAGCFFLS
jgi:hypothetical protein